MVKNVGVPVFIGVDNPTNPLNRVGESAKKCKIVVISAIAIKW